MQLDLNKLKKRSSYPFETIAVAVSFSPRCLPVLAEAKRLSNLLNASLILIHIGSKTSDKEKMLDDLMDEVGIDDNKSRIIWMEGEPVETILKLCKLHIVDLLIIGALVKENFVKFYLGSIARKISRKAKCSVLLLTNPTELPHNYKKFVINGIDNPKTIHTISTAFYLAKHLQVKDINIVNETEIIGLDAAPTYENLDSETKKSQKKFAANEEKNLQSIIEKNKSTDFNITTNNIKGKPGYAISKFAKDNKADLLIINSPDVQLSFVDRIFTHDIEYILADLPCNLLIIHSRV
jgi:nucleotide-binding universal stress UspA family protein